MPRDALPIIRVKGSHFEIGQQLGRACREAVRASVAEVASRRPGNMSYEEVVRRSRKYIAIVEEATPHIAEEVRGLAAGAEITYEEAFMIQMRREIARMPVEDVGECTTVAVAGEYTASGKPLLAQNQDSPSPISGKGIVLEITRPDGLVLLMHTPLPGLLGYRGLNSAGLVTVGNAVDCLGWRVGYPRYLLVRHILEHTTVDAAVAMIRRMDRASSANSMISDASGKILEVEFTPQAVGVIERTEGFIAHGNNLVHPELTHLGVEVGVDSPFRQYRMEVMTRQAIAPGRPKLDVPAVQALLRDHQNFPLSICKHPEAPDKPKRTVSSMIMDPSEGALYVAPGNPCEEVHTKYVLGG